MPVNVAVIGCGAIGQRRHIPEAAANANAKLVAVCDVNKPRVQEVAQEYGAQAFTDHKEMLKALGDRIEAVVVGTPNYLHAQQTIDALGAGKHVLVEKPMAATRDEAKSMIKAAEKSKKFLMVGQNQRLMPPHVKAKEILDSDKLGRPLAFQTTFKHSGPEGWSLDGAKSWFFRKNEAIMGVTGDLGVQSGYIATNGKELSALKRLGERNYFEFNLAKAKTPQKVGDITLLLKKTDQKKNKYTVEISADDKKTEKKDKNVNEPVQFYVAKARQPYELVVNEVGKDLIKGYLATPKDQIARN